MCDWQMYHGTMLLLLYNSCSPFLSFHAVFSGYVFLLFFEILFHTKKSALQVWREFTKYLQYLSRLEKKSIPFHIF